MMTLNKTLPILLALALAAPLSAQTTEESAATEGDATTETEAPIDPLALSSGEEVSTELEVGGIYIDGEFGDWELRCVKAAEGTVDPCQMYQLLNGPDGNPVAEINIFPLPGGEGQPAAGATIITPLETLLTQQLGMSVDGTAVRKYPYSWCSTVGCFSRIGFSDADVAGLKRGINATLIIVPVAAADQKFNLTVSLKGFTAAFTEASSRISAE